MRKLKKNDEVIVIAGSHKGQSGRILSIDWTKGRVKVDKVAVVKKHVKPSQQNPEGGIQEFEATIAISNVALKGKGKTEDGTRVGFKINKEGKKTRIAKKTGKEI